jgi:hypothetical protein
VREFVRFVAGKGTTVNSVSSRCGLREGERGGGGGGVTLWDCAGRAFVFAWCSIAEAAEVRRRRHFGNR